MVNKNIIKIRKELDKLDNNLLNIIKKRSKLVDKVIKNKKYKKDIVDKKRISVILKYSKKIKKKKIDPKITNKIWTSMIKALLNTNLKILKEIIIYCVEEAFFYKNFMFEYLDCIFNLSFSLAFSPFVGFLA